MTLGKTKEDLASTSDIFCSFQRQVHLFFARLMMDQTDKKNILFLSCGEDLFQNPILQNQFIRFAENFDSKNYSIHVLSFIPISRSRLFNNSSWLAEKNKIKERLQKHNIHFKVETLPALASWLYSNLWQFFLFHNFWHHLRLYFYIRRHGIKIVSARSYHAGYMALRVRQLFGANYKVHFDPRGLFVEEGQFHKKIGFFSLPLWKKVEKFNYENADLVSFVSEPFAEIVKNRYLLKKSAIIYTHADLDVFTPSQSKTSDTLYFCYSGQLDDFGWHQTQYLLNLFSEIHKVYPNSKLFIITQSQSAPLRDKIKQMNLTSFVEILRAQGAKAVAEQLRQCHYALICYRPITNSIEKVIAQTIVGSKSGEYLACGLPILCNEELLGISKLVNLHSIGMTYELGQENLAARQWFQKKTKLSEMSLKCREVAENLFGLQNNCKNLQKLLETLCVPSLE